MAHNKYLRFVCGLLWEYFKHVCLADLLLSENDIAFFMEYAPKRNEIESPLGVWGHA